MSRSVLHIDSFIDWVGRQPPKERYHVGDPKSCALGQYAQSWGGQGSTADFELKDAWGMVRPVQGMTSWRMIWAVAPLYLVFSVGWSTFGALHKRLLRARRRGAAKNPTPSHTR